MRGGLTHFGSLARRQSLDEPAADLAEDHLAGTLFGPWRSGLRRSTQHDVHRPLQRRHNLSARTNEQAGDVRARSEPIERQRDEHVSTGAAQRLDDRTDDGGRPARRCRAIFASGDRQQFQAPGDLLQLVRGPGIHPCRAGQRDFGVRARAYREWLARRRQHQVAHGDIEARKRSHRESTIGAADDATGLPDDAPHHVVACREVECDTPV